MRVTGLVLEDGRVINLENLNSSFENAVIQGNSVKVTLRKKLETKKNYRCLAEMDTEDRNKVLGLCSASVKAESKHGGLKDGKLRYHECIALLDQVGLELECRPIKIVQFGCKIYYICRTETLEVDRITFKHNQIDFGVENENEIVKCKDAVILMGKQVIKVEKDLNALTYVLDADGMHCKIAKLHLLTDNMRSKSSGQIIDSKCGISGNVFALSIRNKYIYLVEFTGVDTEYKSCYVGKVQDGEIKYTIIKKLNKEYIIDTNVGTFRIKEEALK